MAESVAIERVSRGERIASLDVIRGIAILFILFMNIPAMGGYLLPDPRIVAWTGWDQFAFSFQLTLHGTQRGLLQLLFGAGILIMARKAMMPDGPVAVADLHYRRNLLLVGFGLINAIPLFWFGDILLPYGIAALLLFPARLWTPRTLIIAAAAFMALAQIPFVQRYADRAELQSAAQMIEARQAQGLSLSDDHKKRLEEWKKVKESFVPLARSKEKQKAVAEERSARVGSIVDYALFSWKEWLTFFQPAMFWGVMADIVGNMLLGMALFKLGFLQGHSRRSTYVAVLAGGYLVGLSLRAVALDQLLAFTPGPRIGWLVYDISRLGLTLGHVAAIHLLLSSAFGTRLLSPFKAAGRMPLTVYLSASFITMWVLFPGFALGLFGRFGNGGLMLIAMAIIAVQTLAANAWLRRYETGPLEWLWKSLAYGRRQPYRKVAPAIPAAAVPAE